MGASGGSPGPAGGSMGVRSRGRSLYRWNKRPAPWKEVLSLSAENSMPLVLWQRLVGESEVLRMMTAKFSARKIGQIFVLVLQADLATVITLGWQLCKNPARSCTCRFHK